LNSAHKVADICSAIGFIYQKQLVLTGRFKDLIIVNGQNYHAHDLEQLCEALPEMGQQKAAACTVPGNNGEALAVFVTYKDELSEFIPIANAIRGALAKVKIAGAIFCLSILFNQYFKVYSSFLAFCSRNAAN
jgi:acyl-CoA synthetase (AMP-forming)/AMP-acid ligase II